MDTRRRRPLRLGQWLQIVAAGILGMIVALLLASAQSPVYQSDAKFFVSATTGNDPAANAQAGDFAQQRVKSYPSVVVSQPIMQSVITQLHLSTTPTELAKKVSATVPLDTVVLDVTASDSTAAGAQRIASAIANVLPSYLERLERGTAASNPITVTTVQAPTLPNGKTSPKTALDLVLGLIVGLACGAAWVLWRASRDDTIRSAADVEAALDTTVLSEIPGGSDLRPATPGVPLGAGWDSPRSEAYRRLRTSLQFACDSDRAGVVVVTSASPREGRTTTAANLATALALAGQRVILIDGDLREPQLSAQFGYDGETGLTDVLRGRSRLESEVRLWQADLNLGILPAGGTVDNPSELLSSQALVSVLDTCRRSADVVLIDTPPLLNVTDGAVVAGLADGALLVVRHGDTTAQSAAAAAAQLRTADTELHGVIINHVPGALASRLRFRQGRDVEIPEIPAVLTPAVSGSTQDAEDDSLAAPGASGGVGATTSPESVSASTTTARAANGSASQGTATNPAGAGVHGAGGHGAGVRGVSAHDVSAQDAVSNGAVSNGAAGLGVPAHSAGAYATPTNGAASQSAAPVVRRF